MRRLWKSVTLAAAAGLWASSALAAPINWGNTTTRAIDPDGDGIVSGATTLGKQFIHRALIGLSPFFSVASGLGGGGPGLDKCNVAAAVTLASLAAPEAMRP